MIGRVAIEQYKNNDFISMNDIDVKARLKSF
jgi:N6-L-threonylcarbamoyladenine synthase